MSEELKFLTSVDDVSFYRKGKVLDESFVLKTADGRSIEVEDSDELVNMADAMSQGFSEHVDQLERMEEVRQKAAEALIQE